jgi:hypothetical protein
MKKDHRGFNLAGISPASKPSGGAITRTDWESSSQLGIAAALANRPHESIPFVWGRLVTCGGLAIRLFAICQ